MIDKVDILLAVRNGASFIEEQLESIFRQNKTNFHLFIRDNASTDATPDLINKWQERYPDKISFSAGKQDLGIIGNFSTLLEQSSAPYVMFSDADDVWLEDKISITLKAMQEAETGDCPILVYTDLAVVDRYLQPLHASFWKMINRNAGGTISFANALVENKVTGCTMMINRRLAELAAPIPLEVPMHDAWISLIAAAFGRIVPVSKATILYRQHGNNDSGAQKYSWKALSDKFLDRQKRDKIDLLRRLRQRQAQLFLERFRQRLTDTQRELINIYLSLPKSFWIDRAYHLWKHQLFETGFLRKMNQVLR